MTSPIISKKQIFRYIEMTGSITTADLVDVGMKQQASSRRLCRYFEEGLLDRKKLEGNKYEYFLPFNSKFNDLKLALTITNKDDIIEQVLEYMTETNHPYLKFVRKSLGGSAPGGGYTKYWELLIEILVEITKKQ